LDNSISVEMLSDCCMPALPTFKSLFLIFGCQLVAFLSRFVD